MADGAATTTDRASESIHSGPMRESDGRTGVFTQKTSSDGNDVSRETRYPDGSSYESRQTRDPATGNTTLHDVERGSDGKVAREGSVTFDSGGKEIDKQGDQSLFDDDSPPSPPKPVSDESTSSGDEPPPKKDEIEKTDDDPGEKGECEDCSSTEPSIWSDLAAFGRGFVVGALAGAAITAGMIGLAVVSAPLAAAVGVGLAFAGAWGLGSLIGRAISGRVAREEAFETAGGFLGGIVGAGAMAGMLKPKPLPPEAPPPKPLPAEPPPSSKPPIESHNPPKSPLPEPPPPRAVPRQPRINEDHIFSGEGRKGYHSRPGGMDRPNVRIDPSTIEGPNSQGVYAAKVEFERPPGSGNWKPKQGNGNRSTFFPDNWSRQKVLSEIEGAYADALANGGINGAEWTGVSPSGVTISGYIRNNEISSAFPIL